LPHLLCVGGIISFPWFSKELKNNLSKNNWLHGVILTLLVRESIFIGWGFSFPIVLVPRYKLSLCHTSIEPDLLEFFEIGVFTCGLRDHEIHIIWYQSLAPLIRLCPSEFFVSCCFRKKFLSVQFLLFLKFVAYKIFFYFILLLSKIYR
jgi:hypothetical protein